MKIKKSIIIWQPNTVRSKPPYGTEVLIYGPTIEVVSAYCSRQRDGFIGWHTCLHDKQAIDDSEVVVWSYYPIPEKD